MLPFVDTVLQDSELNWLNRGASAHSLNCMLQPSRRLKSAWRAPRSGREMVGADYLKAPISDSRSVGAAKNVSLVRVEGHAQALRALAPAPAICRGSTVHEIKYQFAHARLRSARALCPQHQLRLLLSIAATPPYSALLYSPRSAPLCSRILVEFPPELFLLYTALPSPYPLLASPFVPDILHQPTTLHS